MVKVLIVVFWVVMLCGLVAYPEDGGDTLFQNVGTHLQDHMASQPIWPQLTFECLLSVCDVELFISE
jgi:hypothetical protein